jgi:hypothetical protein
VSRKFFTTEAQRTQSFCRSDIPVATGQYDVIRSEAKKLRSYHYIFTNHLLTSTGV